MRKITTAITAAALAFSMLASAVPAAAVVGYDSAYAGESAFVNITAGQTQNFQVFFANTGTTAWQRGTGTQVDLAACLEDKVTCNAQDASEATWNSGWLSATRYATTVQTITPPGSLGTFSYNIMAPTGVAAGIYRFNGDLVLASTGEKIHPDGYYQEANTGGSTGAPTITTCTTSAGPCGGTAAGGTTVTLTGTGFVCTPAFPTTSFGGSNGIVISCGATSIQVTSPAHAPGSVSLTASNSGSGPSNAVTYVYADTSKPKFTGMTVSANLVTVTFGEPVCRAIAWSNTTHATLSGDWSINNVSNPTANVADLGDNIPLCNTVPDNGVTTATIVLGTSLPNGSFVEVTANETVVGGGVNTSIRDLASASNTLTAPQAFQATATAPESTAPTLVSASGAVNATRVTFNFSEPVYCTGLLTGDITFADSDSTTTDPTVTGFPATPTDNPCGTSQVTADSSFEVSISSNLPADRTYTVTFTVSANKIQDIVGNDLVSGSTVTFTTGAADFTPPSIVDARMVFNAGPSTNFVESSDAFSLTFSEKMAGTAGPVRSLGTISIQDQDGTTATINCTAAAGTDSAACTWNTAITTLNVTLDGGLANAAGTTPGMQIPFNVTAMTSFTDSSSPGNPANILGSADRLVDYE